MILKKIPEELEIIADELRLLRINAPYPSPVTPLQKRPGKKPKEYVCLDTLLHGTNVTLGDFRKAIAEEGWAIDPREITRHVEVFRVEALPVIEKIQAKKSKQIKS